MLSSAVAETWGVCFVHMWVNWLLVIGGIVCVIVELALGAMTGFDLALIGGSAAIGGGFAPIIATAMVGYFGGTTGVSIMMIVLALITLAAALAARETRGGSLTE